jgi:hypothetical protein
MLEVTGRKRVSTALTGDVCCKVWIVESSRRGNAQTPLLEAVFSTRSVRGHLIKGLQSRSEKFRSDKQNRSEQQEQTQELPVLLKTL